MNKELIKAMAGAIREIKGENGESRIKHIDLWNRQVEFLDQEVPFPRPAVFFEFGEILWDGLNCGRGVVYRGKCPVILHIVTDWSGQVGLDEKQLEDLELPDIIASALEGLKGEGFDSFQRYSSIPNHDHEEVVETVERFTVNISKE